MKRTLVISAAAAVAALAAASALGAISAPKLAGTVGPGFTISLQQGGKSVKTLKAGKFTFVVADKASIHNFRLAGPGFNKALTAVDFTGTETMTVTLKPGKWVFFCEPHATTMKGSFTVT